MQLFRKLAGNIFFKIILGFVALSFVLFGISGFILGSPNTWIAKIGDTTIGTNAFNNALRADRELVLANNKSEDALKYLESDQFKSAVLGRLVNKIMIEKLNKDFGVSADKKIILEAIAKDPGFKNQDGKFDHEKFKRFLAKNGLNEERYVNEISTEVTSVMILQTLSLAAPLNYAAIAETESFKQEKRVTDVITISEKNVQNIAKPNQEEMEKFFAENKQGYALPEMRKVSYITFSKKDFAKDFAISDQEIFAEYEKNKELLVEPESRNFYHMLFEKEDEAKEFSDKFKAAIGSDKSKSKAEFLKLAKALKNKDLKTVALNKITQKDLLPQLSEVAFKLAIGDTSAVTQSPLGFHIFLLTEVKSSHPIPFSEVKASLKHKMLQDREEKIVQAKISAIDDLLLTSNSLNAVAKKFNLKINSAVTIDLAGQNESSQKVKEIEGLDQFSENSFALRESQVSKIFYAKNSEGFYAVKIEKIIPAHERDLGEVATQIGEDLLKNKKQKAVKELARKVAEEVKANPSAAAQIAAKYHVAFEKNREFPRHLYINYQGRQMPYQSKFLEELFEIKTGQSTYATPQGEREFAIGILREIKTSKANTAQAIQAKEKAEENFRNEVMGEYNSYLLKLYPVKVNDKIFGKKEQQ